MSTSQPVKPPACELGRLLEEARKDLGIPVTLLAKRAGIGRSTWYSILDGYRPPKDYVIRVLALELRTEPGPLLTARRTPDEPEAPGTPHPERGSDQ